MIWWYQERGDTVGYVKSSVRGYRAFKRSRWGSPVYLGTSTDAGRAFALVQAACPLPSRYDAEPAKWVATRPVVV